MRKILVIGSLNMDFTVKVKKAPGAGETVLAKDLELLPGGKGANQAFAAAKLGADVAMLGAVGDDPYGRILRESLESVGVRTEYLKKSETATGIAVITVDENSENRIVVIPGANRDVDIPYLDSRMDVIAESDIVILQLEIPVAAVTYAAGRAKALGKYVILDPAPASGVLPHELLKNCDLIKPNEHEIRALIGAEEDLSVKEAAGRLQAEGIGDILVTFGAKGSCCFVKNGNPVFVPACKTEAVDTTGAGDCYIAALAEELARGRDMAWAMRFAAKASALSVAKTGAQSSFPSREETEASLKGGDRSV